MDLSLSAEQASIEGLFVEFLEKECPATRVREAEPLGFDPALWRHFAQTGGCGMGLPEASGGSQARLLDAALVSQAIGRTLAPLPFVEHFVACRLLAGFDDAPESLADGTTIATLALRPVHGTRAALVPAGAVAHTVVAWVGRELVRTSGTPPMTGPRNAACLPLADRDVGPGAPDRRVLADGPQARALYDRACHEWRALTAAALVGLAERAFELGLAYVKEREQFGRPIGSFQVLQHGLADLAVSLDGARLLARKAAWAFDEDAEAARRLAGMSFLFCLELAALTSSRALHYHGGVGASLEYDIQLYYRGARGWALVLDDPAREIDRLADAMYGEPGCAAV
jgi:alkylation response protein AidB-like acyl-CoA dehydrogenase